MLYLILNAIHFGDVSFGSQVREFLRKSFNQSILISHVMGNIYVKQITTSLRGANEEPFLTDVSLH